MTPEQIALVQSSFARVEPAADAVATLFYARLFASDPSLRPLFMGDMAEQRRKLMAMLRLVVRGLDRLDGLIPALEALGRRHTIYGVRDEHYATVGDALLWTLEQSLGDDCTPAVREAWAIAYGTLTEMMQAATPQAIA